MKTGTGSAARSWYDNVIDIPEGKVNGYAIKHIIHPAGEELHTANLRTQLFSGDRKETLKWNHDTRWHKLTYSGGTWMTDLPIEQAQHDSQLVEVVSGSVLIGGLGLGYAVHLLASRQRIKRIVVVEKSAEVIELVGQATMKSLNRHGYAGAKVNIIHADIFDYIKSVKTTARERFSYAFYDIWQGDGEATFFQTVVPLLDLSQGRVRNRPVNWNENVMRGQLYHSLEYRTQMITTSMPEYDPDRKVVVTDPTEARNELLTEDTESKVAIFKNWSIPFLKWVAEEAPGDRVLRAGMQFYAGLYGTTYFDKYWQRWTSFVKEFGLPLDS